VVAVLVDGRIYSNHAVALTQNGLPGVVVLQVRVDIVGLHEVA
jgi:hypothetical protein